MEFETLVQSRRSVRGFKQQQVSRAVVEAIIESAKRAPSSMNTQPWHVHVLTGAPLEEVRRRNMEEMVGGAKVKRDIISHGEYQGIHRSRQVDIAKKLFGAMGIARDDKPMRQDWVLRGFRQFDAPVSLVLTYDRVLDPGAVCHFDLGALCYGIVLAAWDRGLGSVINGQGIMRSDIVREVAKIPEDEVIMTCVAMGYPDDNFAANAVRSDREGNDEFVRYVGFADRHREVGGDYSVTKFFVRTRYGLLQSLPCRRNNTRTQRFVAGARELTCGGWLAWFDGSSARGCVVRSMMIPAFPSLLKSSAGWFAVAGARI